MSWNDGLDVGEAIAHARKLLESGDDKYAVQYLTEAAQVSTSADELEEIRSVAEQGRAAAGLFGKRRWDEVLRLTETRGEQAQAAQL